MSGQSFARAIDPEVERRVRWYVENDPDITLPQLRQFYIGITGVDPLLEWQVHVTGAKMVPAAWHRRIWPIENACMTHLIMERYMPRIGSWNMYSIWSRTYKRPKPLELWTYNRW